MSLDSILESIDAVVVSESEMRSLDREAPFFRVAFDLVRETSQLGVSVRERQLWDAVNVERAAGDSWGSMQGQK